jgi:hypothetical protein
MRLNNVKIYKMSTVNRAICVCQTPAIAKKNSSFSGNIVDSSNTNALRYSQIVRGTNNGSARFIYNDLNAFGYYSGAPGGSGAPPRNTF